MFSSLRGSQRTTHFWLRVLICGAFFSSLVCAETPFSPVMGGLYKELPEGLDEVDIIIAGGGTAGCVVASRLSDAYPTLSILIVEGGRDNRGLPNVTYPILLLNNILPGNTDTLFYEGIPEEAVGNRSLVVPSGGVLGGGSSINLLTYSRAQAVDYDQWGVEGWFSKDLVPYLQRLETYKGEGTPGTHGYSGPMLVTPSNYTAKASEEGFIKAAAKLGYPEARDIQDLETVNATQRNIRYVNGGKRQDAASNYLHPRLGDGAHPNLHVLTQHQVIRVLFDGNKASGVEFRPNPKFNDGVERPVQRVSAKKLVVLSSGALGTPLVLERSGVGDPEVLGKAGVDVVAEVPGVGAEYQDHQLMTYAYYSSLLPNETFDAIYSGRTNVDELIQKNDPIIGWTAADVYSKLRPSDEEAKALGSAFESAWNRDYKTNPTKPLSMITSLNGFPGDTTGLPEVQYFSCSTFTPYPYSRGHLHITSKDLDASLDFATGFFADEDDIDIKKSVWSYKKQREIIRRMDIYRGEFAPLHPAFAADSDAATPSEPLDGPLPDDVPDIVYTAEDDAVLEQWLRAHVGTTWHSLGTCKMAPKSEGGVVDSSLSVYGVEKLKIADLSVPPGNVGANTANTAYMIGEKAADIFIQELKA
ncbi:GMC oxidoreductase-domain-containing protein [Aspergillus minisclerotigenes]|uniref:GMC oxidoreductase-domain-containing protein n=1 Tax=Aspergillus minisclerotigenes TaxID=656917 RepID=A0A5N6ILL5_9EURO|nr:GMC oxidoreductase-domain-containing protein [Aspergillus minisclerotigenes]